MRSCSAFGKIFKIAPTLRDSHLVTLLGVGRSGQFTWISRELIDGICLSKVLAHFSEKGESSWKRACRVGAEVGAALDFLHQHKFVHGNLTPRNVLIRAEDNCVKLADALLVQALQGSHLHEQMLTEKRDAEAAYLAPEQYASPTNPITAAIFMPSECFATKWPSGNRHSPARPSMRCGRRMSPGPSPSRRGGIKTFRRRSKPPF